ncbi:hypothetical protein WMY93_030552 [Mugilogobius chulae]|uniref:EGF-like domain-containing protein n=1 Tax=Mugilogobius chulae TaxID=88201 RepID=A0AAW0MHN1_9GOBI
MAAVWLRIVWPLLALCVRLHATESPRLDLLLPYSQGHGPAHSHRRVRDCQPVVHGNSTHETWRSDTAQGKEAESRLFVTDVKSSSGSRFVYGHMTLVQDPLRTLSVLEPGGAGGCDLERVSPVDLTAQSGGCIYAQNAGFFNTRRGQCYGNVVSDGRLVKNSGIQNAQFGIRKNGSLVFGYLSEDEVQDQTNPFLQLVSGVIWLLRDGQVYINQSLEAECDETQETGTLRHFVDVVSARTAVGHDAQGRVVLLQIDGQTNVRGMSLWEVADFLKENGVINAINLDGGGSSTFVRKGSLSSYPSDHCLSDGRWRCARAVSTVLCVHPRRCESDCRGRGRCVSGRCECERGWSGEACERAQCEGDGCGAHGICTDNGCACDAGWTGNNCSRVCPSGRFGDGCNQTCSCLRGSCDPVHGLCSCPPGFTGNLCENVCPLGWFGSSCSELCNCSDSCFCDPQSGQCNASVTDQTNSSLYTAGQCVAAQMFKSWRRDAGSKLEQRYLSQRSWLIVSVSLVSLLLFVSLTFHLFSVCRSSSLTCSVARPYSYVPLNDIKGSVAAGDEGRTRTRLSQSDSDSEDEIWTQDSHR